MVFREARGAAATFQGCDYEVQGNCALAEKKAGLYKIWLFFSFFVATKLNKMKRPYLVLLISFLVFSLQGIAAGINFIENKTWKEVLAMAKKQNKLIFLD